MYRWATEFFGSAGDVTLFGLRAIRDVFRPPYEFPETSRQLFEIGWRSGPLVIASGFSFGVAIALQTRSSMESFGAQLKLPQALSFGKS
jgi:phospholipid/cholesterol/gamma-HCH transport system permease protein